MGAAGENHFLVCIVFPGWRENISPFYKNTNLIRSGTTTSPHLALMASLRILYPDTALWSRIVGWGG